MSIPNPYRGINDYKYILLTTIEELKKAIKENDESHMQVLFDRLEKQVINQRF